jgi:hypothetical protein
VNVNSANIIPLSTIEATGYHRIKFGTGIFTIIP